MKQRSIVRVEITRRKFLGAAAASAGALALGACGGDDGPVAPGTDGGMPGTDGSRPTGNQAPVWMAIPTITFTVGVASSFSIAEYVSDPDGDALTIILNEVPLPAGVTYDAAGRQFVYDGSGAVATTSGHVLTADDGRA